jgi:hypothetical protein
LRRVLAMENDQPQRIPDDEDYVRAEEEEAAAEAGAIGGHGSDEDLDPAERAVREGGGGEAEGFEDAEEELIENVGSGEGNPLADAFSGEEESDLSGAEYGEPDEVDPTEVIRDPDSDDDDPGEGPGIAADR